MRTKLNETVLAIESRNKLRKDTQEYYTSMIEKILRKNLEFPSQVHDLIGLRIVVPYSQDIPSIISHMESFLGGSSARKKEKNTIHLFGQKKISEITSGEYFVWKAIYDIAIPDKRIWELEKIREKIKDKELNKYIQERIKHYLKHPFNAVCELQIQDFDSYLLGMAYGSATDHNKLKENQVKASSFYKLFPKEIYKNDIELGINNLKLKLN
jgi:hypothetical protein